MDDSELAEAVSMRFFLPKFRPHPHRLVGETRRPTQVGPPSIAYPFSYDPDQQSWEHMLHECDCAGPSRHP